MICRRYLEHQGFSSVLFGRFKPLYRMMVSFFKAPVQRISQPGGEVQTAVATLSRQSSLVATAISRKVAAMPPPLLYDLTTLQKEANRQLEFSADKTLSLAQSPYEKKVTPYPRTGSGYISQDVFEEVDSLLQNSAHHYRIRSILTP